MKKEGAFGRSDAADGDLHGKEGAVAPPVAGFEDANLFRGEGEVFGEFGLDLLGAPLSIPGEDRKGRFPERIGRGQSCEIVRIDPDHPGKSGVGPKESSGGVGDVEAVRGHVEERGEVGESLCFSGEGRVVPRGGSHSCSLGGNRNLPSSSQSFRGSCLHSVPPGFRDRQDFFLPAETTDSREWGLKTVSGENVPFLKPIKKYNTFIIWRKRPVVFGSGRGCQ